MQARILPIQAPMARNQREVFMTVTNGLCRFQKECCVYHDVEMYSVEAVLLLAKAPKKLNTLHSLVTLLCSST